MSIFFMAASDSEGKERCKATKLGQAKCEATRRFSQQYSNEYIHLIEVDDAGKVLNAYSRYAARGNRWFCDNTLFNLIKCLGTN